MVIFDVVIVVCALATAECSEHRIRKTSNHYPTAYECIHWGQIEAIKWLESHPDYKLAKYGCERCKEDT